MRNPERSNQLPITFSQIFSLPKEDKSFFVDQKQNNEQNSWQRAKEIILHRVSFKDRVIFEFSPFYLYPSCELGYRTQSWDHPAFRNGIRFVSEVSSQIPQEKVIHFILVDDFNNVPESVTNSEIMQRLMEARRIPELAESVLFSPHTNSQSVFYWESDFVQEGTKNSCSNLDAAFQKEKILFDRKADEMNLQNLKSTLLVVAHPVEFRSQQSLMLSSLLKEMKQPPFQKMSKLERFTTLSEMYCHVWFDDGGNIDNVTRPLWDGNKFVHEELM